MYVFGDRFSPKMPRYGQLVMGPAGSGKVGCCVMLVAFK